jgi:hypothetical protein
MTLESQTNGVRAALSTAGHWLHKHIPAAMKMHTREKLLGHCFLFGLP